MDFKSLRAEYGIGQLRENDAPEDPFDLFKAWFHEALEDETREPNAMVLSTVRPDGFPAARVVLLKGVDHGFVWFTNYGSDKSRQLQETPKASITFWWGEREKQVRITGMVEKVSEAESEAYFRTRPPGSQAGAWASKQSSVIEGRTELEKRYQTYLEMAENGQLGRPPHWGGFRLVPHSFEFWQGRENRLHDRILYVQAGSNGWKKSRLSP